MPRPKTPGYPSRMKPFRALIALVVGLAALLVAVPAQAASNHSGIRWHDETVSVYHQAVSPTAVLGSGLGTVRVFFAPTAVGGTAADGQYLSGTLTTVAQGMPDNKELRAANLVFVFGSEKDQLVVGGVSLYAAAGATLAPGVTVTRPIIGGAGKYKGAVGEAVSTNLGADGWTHVFHISVPS